MKWFKKKICPVCGDVISLRNMSNAYFNDVMICSDCIRKINYARQGAKEGKVNLEELKKMVQENDNKTINNSFSSENDFDYNLDEILALDKKFEKIRSKHFKLLEAEGMLYSTAINLPDINNKATNKCIELCLEDISLASDFKDYCVAYNKLRKIKEDLPNYIAFYYLAQLYCKLGRIDDAIAICEKAISLGYYKDGSKGGMPARLARLLKKKNKIK